jgi:hypothetical protein
MAEGVTPEPGSELQPVAGRELEPRSSKELARYTPRPVHGHETKFRLTYAGLAGLALAAVAAAAVFLLSGKPPKPPAWSRWKPSASGDAALLQIASHVAPAYRLPTGEQLVAVEGGPAEIAGLPVHIVLLKTPSDFSLPPGKSALFTLSGLGQHGSISFGKPSHERMLLLQREALEISLYTFHYVKDVQQVVVILPPAPKDQKPSHAMFFRKNDMKPRLERPLHFTLAERPPSIPSLRGGPNKDFLEKVAASDLYNFDVTQAPDASVLLELAHFPIQGSAGGGSSGSGSGTSGTKTP